MTTLPQLIDVSGKPFPLERQLASGGEGAVFTLPNDKTQVAKVYHKPPTTQTVEKLRAMVGLTNPELVKVTTWPNGLLLDARSRQVAGFVMPRLTDFQPIQQLYNPAMRWKTFSRAGWKFQVCAAQNLAAAFDEVHKTGCLIGDVNQSNVQVSSQAMVRLIDCDSFQLRSNGKQFLCEVGVPHYTPPELQGKSSSGVVRTENHDRFGLAVLIYQLLFVGRHPYMGRYLGAGDPSFEQLIAEFRFAQGPASRNWEMDPPPHTPIFTDIPPEVCSLFRRSFERGSETGTRPLPIEWFTTLKQLGSISEIAKCPIDPGHEYWRGASSCIWCRIASVRGGPQYYFAVSTMANTFTVSGKAIIFAVDEKKLQEVLRRLAAVQLVVFVYDVTLFSPIQLARSKTITNNIHDNRSVAIALYSIIGVCLLTIPFGIWYRYNWVIGLLGAIVFRGFLALFRWRSPWHRELRQRKQLHNHALNKLDRLKISWQQSVQQYRGDYSILSEEISAGVAECRNLAAQYKAELQQLSANAESDARVRHLRLHLICDAKIDKVGAGRKQTLATHNIYTAADIDEHVIRQIDGFGDALTGNLLAWRKKILRQFRFDPHTAMSPTELRPLQSRFQTRQQQIINELDQRILKLESLTPACSTEIQLLIPKLKDAVAEYEQTKADLELMTLKN